MAIPMSSPSHEPAGRPLRSPTRLLLRSVLAAVLAMQLAVPAWSRDMDRVQTAPTAPKSSASSFAAPEIDAGLAGAALTLLVGGALLLTDRRRAVRT